MSVARRVLGYGVVHVLALLCGIVGLWISHVVWSTGIVAAKPPLEMLAHMIPLDRPGDFISLLWPLQMLVVGVQVSVRFAVKAHKAAVCCVIVFAVCLAYQTLMTQIALGNL